MYIVSNYFHLTNHGEGVVHIAMLAPTMILLDVTMVFVIVGQCILKSQQIPSLIGQC
jgi:hypothetical protein